MEAFCLKILLGECLQIREYNEHGHGGKLRMFMVAGAYLPHVTPGVYEHGGGRVMISKMESDSGVSKSAWEVIGGHYPSF